MYGKFFASTFQGSMMAAGPEVFAVWAYVIANASDSHVELNPKLLAAVIGSTPERMERAIEALCAPDPASRSKANEGRRLVREGQFQYHVTNHAVYRSIRNEDERREYNRIKKREERERKGAQSRHVKRSVIDVSSMSTLSAHTETEAEAEAETRKTNTRASREPAAPALGVSDLVALGIERQHAADWIKARGKVPLTATALAGVQREAEKAGITLAGAVQICAERGWRGFKADWYQGAAKFDPFEGAI